MTTPLMEDELRDLVQQSVDRGEGAPYSPYDNWQIVTLRAMDDRWLSVLDQADWQVDELALEGDGTVIVHGGNGAQIVRLVDGEPMLETIS